MNAKKTGCFKCAFIAISVISGPFSLAKKTEPSRCHLGVIKLTVSTVHKHIETGSGKDCFESSSDVFHHCIHGFFLPETTVWAKKQVPCIVTRRFNKDASASIN